MRNHYKEGDTITKIDYENLQEEVKRKFEIQGKLEENLPVYIDYNVGISRVSFRKDYPSNKIVTNPKEAKIRITKTKPYCYIPFGNNPSKILDTTLDSYQYRINNLNEQVDFVNGDFLIINPKNITFKSANEELPIEMKNKISSMLKSPDKETFDLGWKILFEYDYLKCLDRFFLLIAKANKNTYYRRKKTRAIEQKLNYIKEQFPNCKF